MVVRDEWWGISGERWVWWEMNVYTRRYVRWGRGVVWDVYVCEMLCEMNEMSGVKWWWEMSDVRWGERWCQMNEKVVWERLPRTQFTHNKAPNPHVSKTSAQNFRSSYWHSYPERSLHTARRQTRMSARHQRKISQLLLARLPRTTFTHSKPPNPHASNTSTQAFRSSYWHGYPERRLHPASCQTPHVRNTSKQNFRIFYCHSINTKVSQLLNNCGDTGLSHRHLLCKRQYNCGDTGLSHKHLLCKRQYNCGDTGLSHKHLLCKRQYNCGDNPAGAQRRHRAPQPLLEPRDIAPATQTETGAQRRHRAPQPLLEARDTAPARQIETGAQWRHRAPQPLLEGRDTAPATETNTLLEPRDTAPATQTETGAQRRHRAPQPLLEALDTARWDDEMMRWWDDEMMR